MIKPLTGALLRVPWLASRVPVEAVKKAHRASAWAVVLWSALHIAGHYRNFAVLGSMPAGVVLASLGMQSCAATAPPPGVPCWTLPGAARVRPASGGNSTAPHAVSAGQWLLLSGPGLTGHVMLALLVLALPLASCWAVRARHHEAFYWSHAVMFLGVAVCLVLHGRGEWLDASRWWVMAVPSAALLAQMGRQWSLSLLQRAAVVSAVVDDSGVARLEVAMGRSPLLCGGAPAWCCPCARGYKGRPKLPWVLDPMAQRGFASLPGQFVLLRVPSLGAWEWHPFSVSSAPSDDRLVLHARPLGDFTGRVVREVCLSAEDIDKGAKVRMIDPGIADAVGCCCCCHWVACKTARAMYEQSCGARSRCSGGKGSRRDTWSLVAAAASQPVAAAPDRRIVVRSKSFRAIGALDAGSDLALRAGGSPGAGPATAPGGPAGPGASLTADDVCRGGPPSLPRPPWRPVPVQVAGPFAAGAQLCTSPVFSRGGVVLAAAGVGATPFIAALRAIHAAYDGAGGPGDAPSAAGLCWHGRPSLPAHVTLVWVVPTVSKAAWALPTIRDAVTSYAVRSRVRVVIHVTKEERPPACVTFSTRVAGGAAGGEAAAAAAAIGVPSAGPPAAARGAASGMPRGLSLGTAAAVARAASRLKRPVSESRRTSDAVLRDEGALRHRSGSVMRALGAGAVFAERPGGGGLPAVGEVAETVPLGDDDDDDAGADPAAVVPPCAAPPAGEMGPHPAAPVPAVGRGPASLPPPAPPAAGRSLRDRVKAARRSAVSEVEGRVDIGAGRPDWSAVLRRERREAAARTAGEDGSPDDVIDVGVFACGPPAMSKELAAACRACSDEVGLCGAVRRAGKAKPAEPEPRRFSVAQSRAGGRGGGAVAAAVVNPMASAPGSAAPPSGGQEQDSGAAVRFTFIKESFW